MQVDVVSEVKIEYSAPMGTWLDAYIESLPQGIDSHAEACAKAGMLANHIAFRPTSPTGLPSEIVKLIENPVPVNIWFPEVHWVALCMAHADEFFAGDEQAFCDDEKKRVDVLFNSPLYRVFFLVSSPKMLIKGAVARWSRFHKGSTIHSRVLGETELELELRFPPFLFPELFLKMLGVSFHVLIEETGGKNVESTLSSFTAEKALFHFDWK